MAENKKELKFEQALARLEEILEKLDGNDCELEDSLKLFEEGMVLVRFCRGKLADVEQKISMLIKETGEVTAFTGDGGE